MASQTNGRNAGGQDTAMAIPSRSERRSAPSPPDIHALNNVWTCLQRANHQLATSHKESCDAQGFLRASIEGLLNHSSAEEQKCREYYKAYKSMQEQHGPMLKEVHSLAAKNIALLGEIENADAVVEAANRKTEELDALSTDLAERNVSLLQDLDQTRERVSILEGRIRELEPPPGGAIGSKSTEVHELDTIDQRSPVVRIMELQAKLTAIEGEQDNVVEGYKSALAKAVERISAAENKLKQFEDKENGLDTRETDSISSLVSKRASPSPTEGGYRHGNRRQSRRGKGRSRKLVPTNPDLTVVCN